MSRHALLTLAKDGRNYTGLALLILCVFSTLSYVRVVVNVPVAIWPAAPHDDGLYIRHGFYIATGQWLGPYSQFTLMKGPGYPIFLALASLIRVPVPLAESFFYALSVGLVGWMTLALSRSYILAAVVFESLLWHFGPVGGRISRDNIYPSLFLISISLLVISRQVRCSLRYLLVGLSGLFFGWLWITREEGIVVLPAFGIVLAYFIFPSFRTSELRAPLLTWTLLFVATSALAPLAVSLVNRAHYGVFQSVDISGDFASALNALESIESPHNIPFLPVSLAVREKAYVVSPTFARLRRLFDDPGSPAIQIWKTFGCQYLRNTCGDYAIGWFMWAFRDAAASDGVYQNASKSAAFYEKISSEISHACNANVISCHHSPIPLMPNMSFGQMQAIPKSMAAVLRMLTFREKPAIQQTTLLGTKEQVQDAAVFLNVQNYLMAADSYPSMLNSKAIARAVRAKTRIIGNYAHVLPTLLSAGFVAFLLVLLLSVLARNFSLLTMVTSVAWLAVAMRIVLLALIDVSSFPAVFNQYIAYAYALSCFASITSLYLLGVFVREALVARSQRTRSEAAVSN